MAFGISDLNACVQKMRERAVSFIAEAFDAPCRMAMIEALVSYSSGTSRFPSSTHGFDFL